MNIPSTQTRLRLATIEDRTAVIDAFDAYLNDVSEFGHDVLPTCQNAELYWSAVFEPAIRDNRSCIFLAEQDGDVIAALFWFIPEQTGLEMKELVAWDHGVWVHPAHRRRHWATELRKHALNYLRSLDVDAVVSTILLGNSAGVESYRKIGGRITGYMVEIPVKGEP